MKIPAYGSEYDPETGTALSITVHALKENKRPIGFAPWPESKPKPKRTRKPKDAA